MKSQQQQTPQSQLWESIAVIGLTMLGISYVGGYWSLPESSGLVSIGATLYTVVKWSVVGVGVLMGGTVMGIFAWYAPVMWKRRKKALVRAEVDTAIIRHELLSSRAEVAAKFAAIQNEQLKTQAEIRRMGYVIEQVTANKQLVAIDTTQANPLHTARLFSPTPPLIENGSAEETAPNIVDLMLKSQRMVLVAPSGSGKTNLLKHYVSRLGDKRLILIDPHSPNRLLGRDVIGAGLNFEAIKSCMLDIMHTVSQRYESGQIAQDGNMGQENTWVVIDEFRDILKNVGEVATDFLEMLLVRSRKVGYKVLLINQNDTANSFGLKGDMGLLQTCAKFSISHNIATDERKAVYGWTKANSMALSMPGLFEGALDIPASQLVVEQPKVYTTIEQKLLSTLIKLNGSAATTSKREIFRLSGVSKNSVNGKLLDELRGV